jgi:hypothetical protein
VDRAGWEEWKIEIPARREKKVKGGGGRVHSTFHSNFSHKKFQLEVGLASITYIYMY